MFALFLALTLEIICWFILLPTGEAFCYCDGDPLPPGVTHPLVIEPAPPKIIEVPPVTPPE